jgi:hypothetical protein
MRVRNRFRKYKRKWTVLIVQFQNSDLRNQPSINIFLEEDQLGGAKV